MVNRQNIAGFTVNVLFLPSNIVYRQYPAGFGGQKMNSVGIAEAVRQRRQALGLTQPELADLAEVSERLIRDLETGTLTVGIDKLLSILESLGLEIRIEKTYRKHSQ